MTKRAVTDPAEQRRVFDLIWSHMPHMQKRTSSTWWFFLLCPEGDMGYGPEQLMFSVVSRVGDKVKINGVWQPGFDLGRQITDERDAFHAMSVGWHGDDQRLYEHLLRDPALAVMSKSSRRLEVWTDGSNDNRRGGSIWAGAERPLSLEAHFKGKDSEARFTVWGDLSTVNTSPHESINWDTPVGGTHFIAWRLINFEGEFSTPAGNRRLSGKGYFQRVCLNAPTFPWKWVWTLFADGSLFSAYVPYLGLNLFRNGYRFFKTQALENAHLPIMSSAYWDPPGSTERIFLDTCRVKVLLKPDGHPDFVVHARSRKGDYLKFDARTYGHARCWLDRPVLGGLLETHWDYNEFLHRTENLEGRIGGRSIDPTAVGEGFGSLEYSWGLGL